MSRGYSVGLFGWIFAVVTCVLPRWRITIFIGANIVQSSITFEGIWIICILQSTGQMQCKVYDSTLPPSSDLQAARTMTIISIITAALSLTVSIMGSKCTSTEDKTSKKKIRIISGICFIIAGLLVLIPVTWTSNKISQDFYSPTMPTRLHSVHGASLYTGFTAAVLLFIGGALQCCTRLPKKWRQVKWPL